MPQVSEQFDRLKASLAGFVKTVMNRIDYLALYPARVVQQNGDGSLQVYPDDTRLPVMDKLKIRYGTPGTTVKVSGGTRVLVGFSNGRPSQPYAALWDPVGTVNELDMDATLMKFGLPAADAMVMGTTYRTAQQTLDTAWGSFFGIMAGYINAIKPQADPLNAATPLMIGAITSIETAITTFEAGSATYLSTKTKTG